MSSIEGACDLRVVVPPKEKDGAIRAKYATMETCLMSCRCMLFFLWRFTFGRSDVYYRHPFRRTILYLWLVGWSGIYSLRPTDQSRDLVVPVRVEAIASSRLFDNHSFVEEKAKELFELRLAVGMTSRSRVGRAKPSK